MLGLLASGIVMGGCQSCLEDGSSPKEQPAAKKDDPGRLRAKALGDLFQDAGSDAAPP